MLRASREIRVTLSMSAEELEQMRRVLAVGLLVMARDEQDMDSALVDLMEAFDLSWKEAERLAAQVLPMEEEEEDSPKDRRRER